MNWSLPDEVVALCELESNPRSVLQRPHSTGRAVIVSDGGEQIAAVLDPGDYYQLVQDAQLAMDLRAASDAERAYREGETLSHEEVMGRYRHLLQLGDAKS